ncbi:hypothetical protein NH340_JMT01492 [Sarcoptes scabiei]|nr:hypothetical protein NH340_JMT01492 [Sarcoptes scabiei]
MALIDHKKDSFELVINKRDEKIKSSLCSFYQNDGFISDDDGGPISHSEPKIAVRVKNVHLSYGKISVLNGINMKVPFKKIYALLGPSGCGKTSLLRCVVGINRPQQGEILVYGNRPGTIESCIPGPGLGYTPQEIALFEDFTIAETFEYFGRLFHMKSKKIIEQTERLIRLLNLPRRNYFIRKLSGGQKRRVSLAVALIHSPPLLILDEPTVGVDPILRQNIWDHLHSIVKQMDLTIIITTQYIEEAKSADLVSLMRSGRLMVEENPLTLLQRLGQSSLEDVFLKLCQIDDQKHPEKSISNRNGLESIIETISTTEVASESMIQLKPFRSRTNFEFIDRIRALNWKNLITIRRNLSMLIIQFLMPSFQCFLNFICLGPDPYDLPIAIVNEDQPPIVSNLFIRNLNNITFRSIVLDELENGLDQIRNGLAWALIRFPKNYTKAMQRISSSMEYEDDNKLPQIDLHLDTTNYVIINTIQKNLWFTYNQTMAMANEIFVGEDPQSNLAHNQQNPFNSSIVYGVESPEMSEYMAPGLLSMAIFFAAMALTAITLVLERKNGIFERTLVSGVRTFEFVVSQISTQLLVLAVQVFFSIITMLYILDIDNKGSITLIYSLTLIQGMCGMALGLVVSAFSRNESQALALSMAFFLPVSIISGIFWPIESMPLYMKPISLFGPQTYSLKAMRSVISYGWSIKNPLIIYGLISSTIWFIFLVLLATFGFKMISFY